MYMGNKVIAERTIEWKTRYFTPLSTVAQVKEKKEKQNPTKRVIDWNTDTNTFARRSTQ